MKGSGEHSAPEVFLPTYLPHIVHVGWTQDLQGQSMQGLLIRNTCCRQFFILHLCTYIHTSSSSCAPSIQPTYLPIYLDTLFPELWWAGLQRTYRLLLLRLCAVWHCTAERRGGGRCMLRRHRRSTPAHAAARCARTAEECNLFGARRGRERRRITRRDAG